MSARAETEPSIDKLIIVNKFKSIGKNDDSKHPIHVITFSLKEDF